MLLEDSAVLPSACWLGKIQHDHETLLLSSVGPAGCAAAAEAPHAASSCLDFAYCWILGPCGVAVRLNREKEGLLS